MDDEKVVEEASKGGKGKLIGIISGVLVLFAAVWFLFLSGGGGDDAAADTTTTVPVEGVVIEADQMTVTLADEDVRYARIRFGVVLPEGGDTAAVGERMPVLKDAVLDVLAGYTAAELIGRQALADLRGRLTAAALDVFPDGEVLRVVVTEVLVQ